MPRTTEPIHEVEVTRDGKTIVRYYRAQQVTQNLKEVVTYEGAHIRVRVARGDASGYACIDCGGHARQWALTGRRRHADAKGRPYSTDIDDYSPMCIRCHRWHDRTHLIADLREVHTTPTRGLVPYLEGDGWCGGCGEWLPCPTLRCADRAEQRLREAGDG